MSSGVRRLQNVDEEIYNRLSKFAEENLNQVFEISLSAHIYQRCFICLVEIDLDDEMAEVANTTLEKLESNYMRKLEDIVYDGFKIHNDQKLYEEQASSLPDYFRMISGASRMVVSTVGICRRCCWSSIISPKMEANLIKIAAQFEEGEKDPKTVLSSDSKNSLDEILENLKVNTK